MEINVQVTKDNVCFLDNDQVHENEVNVDTLVFSFSEEYTDDLVKIAVFTNFTGTTYRMTILNNKCAMPYEALLNKGLLTIGVYAFKEQDGELMLRYSPTPLTLSVENGSYIDGQDGTVLVPALTLEEYEQAIQEALTQFELDKDAIIQEAKEEFEEYYNGKVADFNTNATNKTNDYNTNATQKLGTYNTNASEKLGEYNTNASNKTDTFNSNATSKTTAFDNNASDKTTTFNSNATSKTNDFNSNATSKTTDFNNNATSKTSDFNTNASNKTTAFNDNATSKTEAYNNNAEEKVEYYDEHASEIIEMNELLLNAQPTNTATGETIHVADSAKLPLANFEMVGNATQADTPTPETPQAIHVVTGDNTIKVYGGNLFDEETTKNATFASATFAYTGVQLPKNTELYFKAYLKEGKTDISGLYVAFTTVGSNPNNGISAFPISNGVIRAETSKVFTTDNLYFAVYPKTTNIADIFNTYKFEVSIVTNAPYEKYQGEQQVTLPLGDIELAKIGDYKDRIFKAEVGNTFYDSLTNEQKATLTLGKWYVYKAIGNINIGTSGWTRINNAFQRSTAYPSSLGSVSAGGFSSIYKFAYYSTGITTNIQNNEFGWNASRYLTIRDDRFSTASEFAEWLGENNVPLYFPLVTPTITEITDTALITALEQVLAMTTYKTTTNAFTLTVSDNATPILQVEYRQDIGTLISNLNNAILSLGNNV